MEQNGLKQETVIIVDNLFWSFLNTHTRITKNTIGINFNFKRFSDEKVYINIFTYHKDDKKKELDNIAKSILESSKHCIIEKRKFPKILDSFYYDYIQKEWKNKEWAYALHVNEKKEISEISICIPKIYDQMLEKIFLPFELLIQKYLFNSPLKNQFINIIESEMEKEFFQLEKNENEEIIACLTLKQKKEFFETLSLYDIEFLSLENNYDIKNWKEFIDNQFPNQKIHMIKKNDKFAICALKTSINEIISLLKSL